MFYLVCKQLNLRSVFGFHALVLNGLLHHEIMLLLLLLLLLLSYTCCSWNHGLRRKKSFKIVVAVPPAPVRVLSQRPLASHVTRVMSVTNDWVAIIWCWGPCTVLLAVSARRPSIKAARPVISSNWVPYLQMRLVGLHRTSGREKKRKK